MHCYFCTNFSLSYDTLYMTITIELPGNYKVEASLLLVLSTVLVLIRLSGNTLYPKRYFTSSSNVFTMCLYQKILKIIASHLLRIPTNSLCFVLCCGITFLILVLAYGHLNDHTAPFNACFASSLVKLLLNCTITK